MNNATRLSVLLATLLVAGCVMPSDIRALEDSSRRYQVEVEKDVAAWKSGTITEAELDLELQKAQLERERDIAQVAATVEARTQEAIRVANAIKNGSLSLEEGAGLASLITTGGVVALNALRSRSRRRELEKIKATARAP